MVKTTLLLIASVGWLTSVLGAVFLHLGAAKLRDDPDQGSFTISTSESHARWGLTLVIAGASAGALGTILAVVSST